MSSVSMPEFLPSSHQHIFGRRRLAMLAGFIGLVATCPAKLDDKDILDRLVLIPTAKTFTNLVAKAGLIETLKSEGTYTLFVPTDESMARLTPESLQNLKRDRVLAKKFVTYHLVNLRLASTAFKEGDLKTVEGENVVVKLKGGLKLNNSKITVPDSLCSNGLVHVVDAPLIPPSLTKALTLLPPVKATPTKPPVKPPL